MPDIALIGSALNSINSAITIAKAVKEANASLETAAFKLKLADLMEHLADSKIQIAEIKTIFLEKDEIIKSLNEQIKKILSEEKPTFKMGCYFFKGDNNPYCTNCWDTKMEKIRTKTCIDGFHAPQCPTCQNIFHINGS